MINDLITLNQDQINTKSNVILGDTKEIDKYLEPNSAKLMITSPPYPGDHEYTKHTRLELIFSNIATNINEFRIIKKRLLQSSTTNIYKEDNDGILVNDIQEIKYITDLIQLRLDEDGASSGFEGLYTKLVWEYFGGMHRSLESILKVLEPGGKIALLVSDSHAFKMVHIKTASILGQIANRLGYLEPEIILWQNKLSTSHRYNLRENVLILQKPK